MLLTLSLCLVHIEPVLTKEELAYESDEFSAVARNFLNTLPKATIKSITKIHNKISWDNFVMTIKHKVGIQTGAPESVEFRENTLFIRPLFHGSSHTDPEIIIEDNVGFNIQYSRDGMWGRGIYFAVNASYSHGFAHKSGDGTYSMFLSQVFVGNAKNSCPNDRLHGPPKGYHSITDSHPAGSKVYILCENGLAYPGYLVKYIP